jgi:hypothetical protein
MRADNYPTAPANDQFHHEKVHFCPEKNFFCPEMNRFSLEILASALTFNPPYFPFPFSYP